MELRPVALMLCVGLAAPTRADAAMATTPQAVLTTSLEHEDFEDDLDPQTLATLDALLLDPVEIASADRVRLLALPWIDSEHLAALSNRTAPRDPEELAQIPGWSSSLARRTAPFIRFAPSPQSDPLLVWNLQALPTAWRGRSATAAGLEAEWRIPYDTTRPRTGYAEWHAERLTVAGGDLRVGHAQGLLAWTSETRVRVPATWRSPRGLTGTVSGVRARSVRGAGVALRTRRGGATLLAGSTQTTSALFASIQVHPDSRQSFDFAALRVGPSWSASGSYTLASPSARVAFELVAKAIGCSGVLAVERRDRDQRGGVRLQILSSTTPALLAGAAPRDAGGRGVELWYERRIRGINAEVAVAQAWTPEFLGGKRLRNEHRLTLSGHAGRNELELRYGGQDQRFDVWQDAAASATQHEGAVTWMARLRRPSGAHWLATFEARDGSADQDETGRAVHRHGRVFASRLERKSGWLRPAAVLASHTVDPGLALAAPAVAWGSSAPRLGGDGVYVAAACRLTWGVLDAVVSGARVDRVDRASRWLWRWGIVLHGPVRKQATSGLPPAQP